LNRSFGRGNGCRRVVTFFLTGVAGQGARSGEFGKGFDAKRCHGKKNTVRDVLVVDDSKVMREMVVACLRAHGGLKFTHAASGLEAIEQLSLAPFDLVVLDLNMPDIGGIEVVEFVRSQDTLRQLPIIVVTTRGDEASRSRALEAGASRFMTKPFTPEALLSEVRALLGSEAVQAR
jgi:two-component system chemotaxis response regulator CheY